MTQLSRTTSRARAVAGLSVGALVASVGMTFLGAGVSSAAPVPAPVTKDFTYTCSVPVLGPQPFGVSVTATPPADPVAGLQIPASAFSTVVTIPAGFASLLPTLGIDQIEGTVDATTMIDNAGNPSSLDVNDLQVPVTPTSAIDPESGDLPVTASGMFPAVTFVQPGATTISVGEVQADIKLEKADGSPADAPIVGSELNLTCTVTSEDTTLLSFDVAEAPVPPVKVDYAVSGTATQATTGTTTAFGPGSLDASTNVETGNFSGQLTLPDIDIPNYQLFGFVPTTVKAKVIPEGPVTGTIGEDGTLTAQSTVSLQLDELTVFGLPLLTPGSKCRTVEPTTVDLTGADFDVNTGGTLTGSYTAANFSGCGLLSFFIEPILNNNVSGVENAISVDFTAPPTDGGPLE